jgi:chlorophyllide a reductase subunit Y
MIHPFYTACHREFAAAGRPALGSAPVGYEGTDEWLEGVAAVGGVTHAQLQAARDALLPGIRAAVQQSRVDARITMSGYEGSELLVARLLVECGADLRYVGTACPRTEWSDGDRHWLESRGVQVRFRASLEDDLAAMNEYQPELVIGTTPVVQVAKEAALPALYFTNLISARPLMGPAGPGSLTQVINAALSGRERFEEMELFFSGVGQGDATGVHEPVLHAAEALG